MKRFITIFSVLTALFIVSCKCPEYVTTTEMEKIIEVRTHDTTIVTAADSASVHALLRCDSAYNVVVWELTTLQGERIEASVGTQKQGKDLLLYLDCKEDSLVNEIQLRDSIISNFEKQTVIVREKYVPDYYKNTSRGFWVLLAILVLIVGWKIAKRYIKIQTGGIL